MNMVVSKLLLRLSLHKTFSTDRSCIHPGHFLVYMNNLGQVRSEQLLGSNNHVSRILDTGKMSGHKRCTCLLDLLTGPPSSICLP